MIETHPLTPGVTLRYFPDSRFKKSAVSIQLLRPMRAEENALNALLPSVLLRGTERHRDLRSITEHLDELYGASIGTMVRRVGDWQTVGFYLSFLEDRFAMPGDEILAPMMEFLSECLLRPVTDGHSFDRDFVDSEKKNLISTIESELNDKRSYAAARLLRHMCRGDSFGLSRLGESRDVDAITPQGLYRHYRHILRTSPVEIFYAGSAPAEQVIRLLRPLADEIAREPEELPAHRGLRPGAEACTLTEEMRLSQSKLCMGFACGITYRHPLFAAMQVLNAVYGAGMTSKLFLNVREKLSLCYYANSAYYGSKGIVTVSCGIDAENFDRAREEILAQLAACQEGRITAGELEAGKKAILSSLRSTPDSPGALEGYYGTAMISGLGLSLEEYAAGVEAVSMEDVVRAARQLRLHTVFLLKGTAQ